MGRVRHPDYERAVTAWSRARDVLAGEDSVKAAGVRYLPRLDSQTDDEYAAYVVRAAFFGATARTLDEYLDLVFRRVPAFALQGCEKLAGFARDCDLWGLMFVRYARRVVSEVLAVGRAGSLVLQEEGRPVVSMWKAEDILDWEAERDRAGVRLSRVVLAERGWLRVLRMDRGACVQEWLQPKEDGAWITRERVKLKRDGVPLDFIPFVFHGATDSRPDLGKLPLADLIAANLDHYRLDADYKHGLHFAALPTAWVSGFDKAGQLRIGSSTAWVSESADASAGFLEFSGAGLAHLEKAMEKVEQRMTSMGARMLEGKPGESDDEHPLSGLGSIVASLNESLSRVLQLAHWWYHGGELDAGVSFAMNTDLGARAMSGDEITAVVEAWRAGAISRDSMLERLKRGEVLPDGRSVAQERALIHGKAKVEA